MKRLLASKNFYIMADKLWFWLGLLSIFILGYGVLNGALYAPIDYQQREAVKIIYLHVPCALLSLSIYVVMGSAAFIFLIWKVKVADIVSAASAPIGACFTAIALFSGAMWGKPMWGTFWVWDARLTSELLLLFLYFGYMALRNSINDQYRASYVSAIIAVAGLIDVPIIHFSVEWWHTLHQGASISRFAKPAIAAPILYPLLISIIGMYLGYISILLYVARTKIIEREVKSNWLKEVFCE